jgi:hypothetical protein
MGAIAANLLRGMPAHRADFNEGRNTAQWLGAAIAKVIDEGKNDERESEDGVVEIKSTVGQLWHSSHFKYSACHQTCSFIKETRDGKISFNKNIRQRQRAVMLF